MDEEHRCSTCFSYNPETGICTKKDLPTRAYDGTDCNDWKDWEDKW